MSTRPRVFLSHSKADTEFITRLYEDLRACQIEPWYDSFDIRHGQPWIDAIFEGGIPSCDCVLVYLTEHSIESQVVKKEIDAGIIQQLKDKRVGILPYVSKSSLRSRLRSDIQSLQVPEWSDTNYGDLLPRVVAEIWHIFCERSVASATNDEKVRRLEAETQVNQLTVSQEDSIFSPGEERDFKFIHSKLNVLQTASFTRKTESTPPGQPLKEEQQYSVNILSLLHSLFDDGFYAYEDRYLRIGLNRAAKEQLVKAEGESFYPSKSPELVNDLLMFGFIQKLTYPKTVRDSGLFIGERGYRTEVETRYEFTPKVHRFRYWLVVHGLTPMKLEIMPNQTRQWEPTVATGQVTMQGPG